LLTLENEDSQETFTDMGMFILAVGCPDLEFLNMTSCCDNITDIGIIRLAEGGCPHLKSQSH
jgi:hypothetical protein